MYAVASMRSVEYELSYTSYTHSVPSNQRKLKGSGAQVDDALEQFGWNLQRTDVYFVQSFS